MDETVNSAELAKLKLEAFDKIRAEFEARFRFVQEVHGQHRFSAFTVIDTVTYLHALWVCECKDRLLSVYKNMVRYEGRHCLTLLQGWQKGDNAPVIAFLQRKLDGLTFVELTQRLEDARRGEGADVSLSQRLLYGRQVLLNRALNLFRAFDSMFGLPEEDLLREVRAACDSLGHNPEQIQQQLADLESPLFSYTPHPSLAQRNMQIMNTIGINGSTSSTDQPGERTWKVEKPEEPLPPFAETMIPEYQELTAPHHNNPTAPRFVDQPERDRPEQGEE